MAVKKVTNVYSHTPLTIYRRGLRYCELGRGLSSLKNGSPKNKFEKRWFRVLLMNYKSRLHVLMEPYIPQLYTVRLQQAI